MRKITETDFIIDIWNEEEFIKLREQGRLNKRYNGGWVKEITGIDKNESNGYSLVGDFLDGGQDGVYRVSENKLYLDCDIDGSRKHHERDYRLFTVKDDQLIILKIIINGGRTWAIDLWNFVEEFFKTKPQKKENKLLTDKKKIKNILNNISTDDILKELIARGHDISPFLRNIELTKKAAESFRAIELDENI